MLIIPIVLLSLAISSLFDKLHWNSLWLLPEIRINVLSMTAFWLIAMTISLIIPITSGTILPPDSVPLLGYFRFIIWLLGLSLFPGYLALRIIKLSFRNISIELAISISLSLFILTVVTILSNFLSIIQLIPEIMVLLISTELVAIFFLLRSNQSASEPKPNNLDLTLLFLFLAVISLTAVVEISTRYMFPGDMWAVVKPSTLMLTGQNVYGIFMSSHYPIVFGHLLLGFTVCTGLPIVNAYVGLFPLTSISLLSFVALCQETFDMDKKATLLSGILFAFGGGWGIIFSIAKNGSPLFDWNVGYMSLDFLNGRVWFDTFFFQKTFAFSLAILSLALLTSDYSRSKSVLFISALFAVFSFEMHMIPIFALSLVFLFFLLRHHGLFKSMLYLLTCVGILLIIDSLMEWYYLALTWDEVVYNLLPIPYSLGLPKLIALLSIVFIAILTLKWSKSRSKLGILAYSLKNRASIIDRNKIPFLTIFMLVLFFGADLFIAISIFSGHITLEYILLSIITSFGIIKYFALIDLEHTFKIKNGADLLLWLLMVIIVGLFWWPDRNILYIFPALSIVSALGLLSLVSSSPPRPKLFFSISENGISHKLVTLPWLKAFFLISLIISSSSILATSGYLPSDQRVPDDEALMIGWAHNNISTNTSILLSNEYNLYTGLEAIDSFQNQGFLLLNNSWSFDELLSKLSNLHPSVAILDTKDTGTEIGRIMNYAVVLKSYGSFVAYNLPRFYPPSSNPQVALIKRSILGSQWPASNIVWLDDSMEKIVHVENPSNTTTIYNNGETLKLIWSYPANQSSGPAITWAFQPNFKSDNLSFIFRYRLNGSGNANFVITNSSKWPNYFVKSINIPKSDSFNELITPLPAGHNLSSFYLWMNQGANVKGNLTLELDYVGIIKGEGTSVANNVQSLTRMLPATWPINYTIDPTNYSSSTVIVTSYDRTAWALINSTNASVFVFINSTAMIPEFGEWNQLGTGVIVGAVNNKTVIVVSASDKINLGELSKELFLIIKEKLPR